MKIGGNIQSFNISSEGLSVQRKKMNLIAENIANIDSVRNDAGEPYQRKFLKVVQNENLPYAKSIEGSQIRLAATNENHIINPGVQQKQRVQSTGLAADELTDPTLGEKVYIPEHPDADKDGYVQMSNVNIITEMTDMIAATRSYEANLTAFNASKQIVKDTLEI